MTFGPAAVREEDAFDVGALHAWIGAHAAALLAGATQPPIVEQFTGGASNLTYLVRYPGSQFVLRRPPGGHKAASAHDMGREVRVQTLLRPHYRLVPEIYGHCQDAAVIGSPFYLMQRIPGAILRHELPAGLSLRSERAHALAEAVIDAHADLHGIDPTSTGLSDLGRGTGYVARQVSGWSRRWAESRTEDSPTAERVISWLDATQPPDAAARLVHGDWRFDNLVLDLDADRDPVRGVLDWEMATVGDPLLDVGAALAYWTQADDDPAFRALGRQPTDLPGMPTRAEYVDRYLARTGLAVDDWTFYEVYGLFRLAVIIQQIWYRYRHGQTSNPAFSRFGAATAVLIERATARTGRSAGRSALL